MQNETGLAAVPAVTPVPPAKAALPVQQPAFSVVAVIPLYNGVKFIRSALESVLNQTRPVDEIIVVDDGSTDDGAELVKEMCYDKLLTDERGRFEKLDTRGIRLLRKPNGGQSSARNFGVQHSSSTHIAFLDQDDRWYPGHVEQLVKPFTVIRPGAPLGWVYSNLDEIDEDGGLVAKSMLSELGTRHPKRHLFDCLANDMFILPSASLISRRAFERVGGFDIRLSGYEDDDLFLKLFRAGFDNIYLDEPLSQWRIYGTSSSYTPRMARSRMIYAKKLLQKYPDEPSRSRFLSRDLIVPRFLRCVQGDLNRAITKRDMKAFVFALDDIKTFAPWLGRKQRLALRLASRWLDRPRHALALLNTYRLLKRVI